MTCFSLYQVESLSAHEKHAFIDTCLAVDQEKFKVAKSILCTKFPSPTIAKDKSNTDLIDDEEGSDQSANKSAK
ncbi:hypothetical protein HK096_005682, partial [Nowakowskiella sp. JEL0078]